jgi:flavin reductase (DIM6/NTAB) family NADH-FMN oxidoreductase RutF
VTAAPVRPPPAAGGAQPQADDDAPGRDACLDLFRRLAAGVAIVTARGAQGPVGMTASSVTSVSLRPPLLLVALASGSRTLQAVRTGRAFAVHLLRADQRDLAERFASRDPHRFAGLETREVIGMPVLADVLAWAVCRLPEIRRYGDHVVVVARVTATDVDGGRPLIWHDRGFAQLAEARLAG